MKTKAFPIAWKRLFDYNKLIHRMHPDCLQAGDHSMRVVVRVAQEANSKKYLA